MKKEDRSPITSLADMIEHVRSDAKAEVEANPLWNDKQSGVYRRAWKGGCKEFEAFLVIMIAMVQDEYGQVRCRPGILSNGSTMALLGEMARFVVVNDLVEDFRDVLLELLVEERNKAGENVH